MSRYFQTKKREKARENSNITESKNAVIIDKQRIQESARKFKVFQVFEISCAFYLQITKSKNKHTAEKYLAIIQLTISESRQKSRP